MNKLIIVGNGFDLAHGLKTSYAQFLKAYLINNIEDALNNQKNSDTRIFDIHFTKSYHNGGNINVFSNAEDIYELYLTKKSEFSRGIQVGLKSGDKFIRIFYKITISSKSDLINRLLNDNTSLLWVDIEKIFYDQLKIILKNDKLAQGSVIKKLVTLNNELEIVKNVLLEHLGEQIENFEFNYKFIDIAGEDIESSHILERDFVLDVFFQNENLDFKKATFLDFNYTSLINFCKTSKLQCEYLHIHGVINDDKYPVIFGYGDEIDEVYPEIERSNINEYLTHIKSFGYFKTNIYSDLKRMIDSDPFVVYIWGHSCGLSDRTLLNMIFENDNCIGIKIFYYKNEAGQDNFDQITQNISRHFKNKMKMRNRVFNKTLCQEIPQMKQ